MTRAFLAAALVLWGGTALPADGKGDYYRNGLLSETLRGQTFTFPTALTARLYSVCPTASTAGTELSGNGYTPPSITSNTSNWTASSSGAVSNAVDISFGTASAQWTAAACVGVTDGANMVMFGDLAAPTTVRAGERAHFPAGSLTFTEDPPPVGGLSIETTAQATDTGGAAGLTLSTTITTAGASLIVIAVASEPDGNYTAAPSGVTVGGNAATLVAGGGNGNWIAGASVWTYASGSALNGATVQATWASNQNVRIMQAFSFTGAHATQDGAATGVVTSAQNLNQTISATYSGSYIVSAAVNAVAVAQSSAGAGTTIIHQSPSYTSFSVRSTTTTSAPGNVTLSTTGSAAGTVSACLKEIRAQ